MPKASVKKPKTEATTFWNKLLYMFSDPNKLFEVAKAEIGIKNALIFYTIIASCVAVIGLGISFSVITLTDALAEGTKGIASTFILASLGKILLGIAITFAYAGMMHLIIRACKGKGTYQDSYKTYTYSIIPFVILKLIPFIGLLSIVYSIIIMVIGTKKIHKINTGQAVVACVIPALVMMTLFVGYFIVIFANAFLQG